MKTLLRMRRGRRTLGRGEGRRRPEGARARRDPDSGARLCGPALGQEDVAERQGEGPPQGPLAIIGS